MANKSKSKSKKTKAGSKNTVADFKTEQEAKIQLKQLAKDERTWKIVGLTFLLVSIFLVISFVSYFYTWRQDFVLASKGAGILLEPDITAENLLGKSGALVAHLFVYKLFGVASLLIC